MKSIDCLEIIKELKLVKPSLLKPIEEDLKVLETLKRNICLNGEAIEFYKDEDRNINCKYDTSDYEKVRNWYESNS